MGKDVKRHFSYFASGCQSVQRVKGYVVDMCKIRPSSKKDRETADYETVGYLCSFESCNPHSGTNKYDWSKQRLQASQRGEAG